MQPLIVLTPGYDFHKGPSRTEYMVRVNRAYAEAVRNAGGVPVLMAWEEEGDLLEHADGVLFTGGEDLDPALYGEEKFNDTVGICALRDRVELAFAKACFAKRIPILGICRGIQTLNVALGGSLWQDIPGQNPDALPHSGGVTHEVTLKAGHWLADLYGNRTQVNSYHHQAVKTPGEGLIPVAWSPDGYIEAVEHETWPLFATQWHPERMTGCSKKPDLPDSAPLFERFVRQCGKYRDEK